MTTESQSWTAQVDERIIQIKDKLAEHPSLNEEDLPGLKSLLDDYIDPEVPVHQQDFHQRLLKVFKDSTTDGTYSQLLSQHTPDEQQRIEKFLAGDDLENVSNGFVMGPSLGCREELAKLHDADSIAHLSSAGLTTVKGLSTDDNPIQAWFHEKVEKLAEFFHLPGDPNAVLVYQNAVFQNWGLNLKNTPQFTCVPNSTTGIKRIVKFAKAHDMGVRCSGYRHSWAPIFGRSGQILISMLDLHTATKLPNTASLPLPESPPTELESINIVPGTPHVKGNSLVRVGCATTNERLRRWCIKNKTVTLPLNVIMVELTLGGSNAPICHGAGRRHQTLSDLVRRIEYVDAHGELRVVEDPNHLRAAAGCFGLMGVVTHLTLEFSPMTYAQLNPIKMPVVKAVPPPADLDERQIPPALLKYWSPLSAKERAACQAEFERQATDDYYCEWFWFPYSDYAWVNSWNDTKDGRGAVKFPDDLHIFLSFVETFSMNVLQSTPLLDKLVRATGLTEAAVTLISRAAMFALPDKPLKAALPDALHFQRAIQNVRVRDIEIEMPLVAEARDPKRINWQPVQRAWWDAILVAYANTKTCPQRMPLEMRIMGGSDIVLAPQRGNSLGTCSIEVLTLHAAADIWEPYAQQVLDKWMALKDPATGKLLRTRPHWAKEWQPYKVGGRPWTEKLREDYKDERAEFMRILSDIGSKAGWTLADLKARFSNDFLDDFYFKDVSLHGTAAKNTSTVTSKGLSTVSTQEISDDLGAVH